MLSSGPRYIVLSLSPWNNNIAQDLTLSDGIVLGIGPLVRRMMIKKRAAAESERARERERERESELCNLDF